MCGLEYVHPCLSVVEAAHLSLYYVVLAKNPSSLRTVNSSLAFHTVTELDVSR